MVLKLESDIKIQLTLLVWWLQQHLAGTAKIIHSTVEQYMQKCNSQPLTVSYLGIIHTVHKMHNSIHK